MHVLHDGQLKPGPGARDGVIAEPLVVGLGEQLHDTDAADCRGVEGGSLEPCLVDILGSVGRLFVGFNEGSDRICPGRSTRGVLGQTRQRRKTNKIDTHDEWGIGWRGGIRREKMDDRRS